MYLALVLACTLLVNEASGLVILAGSAVGLGLLLLPKARQRLGLSFLLALGVGGPLVGFGAEAGWARFGTDGTQAPAAVAAWIVAGQPWIQFRINARLQTMPAADKAELVALLAARGVDVRKALRAFELDAVPLALARGVAAADVARLCAHHGPEVREAISAVARDPAAGIRPGHVACARFVMK